MNVKLKVAIAALLLAGGTVAWMKGRKVEAREEAAFALGVRDTPYASTRGHLDNGRLVPRHSPTDYTFEGQWPKGDEILVVIHGLNNTETKARNRFALAEESLRNAGYKGEILGFSWDGSTNWDPFGATGYRVAKHNAMGNGPKLAAFLTDLHTRNPQAKLRVLGYSMGARLAVEAIYALDQDPGFNGNGIRVVSVHLVGAAIDNEHLQTDERYGKAIERRVGTFFNYYSPLDSKLGKMYQVLEGDFAVGRTDLEDPERAPKNYKSRDVSSELPGVDDRGRPDPKAPRGRNHSAYLGVRDDSGQWWDDGAISVIAKDIAVSSD